MPPLTPDITPAPRYAHPLAVAHVCVVSSPLASLEASQSWHNGARYVIRAQ